MKIVLNSETTECAEGSSLLELIQEHGLKPQTTLVELNGVALPRREWAERVLQENDRLEILRVAAGG